jgi:hypothetical protein
VHAVDVNGCLCVLMDQMGCFEFWSFYVDTDVMQVYVVGTDGHCLGGLSEKITNILYCIVFIFIRFLLHSNIWTHICEGIIVLYAFSVFLCVLTLYDTLWWVH